MNFQVKGFGVENPERYEQSKDKVQEKREEEFIRYN